MNLLNNADFQAAAEQLGCDSATIQAVCLIEAPHGGFHPDGSPVTLFEGHIFYHYTQGKFVKTYPDLCYPHWTKAFYGHTWKAEQERLNRAIKLDRLAALMSTSWGRFQIMGLHFKVCGYDKVEAFVQAMSESEIKQLQAFCQFILSHQLQVYLKNHQWAAFARAYNGVKYAQNHYDEKLSMAYQTASPAAGVQST